MKRESTAEDADKARLTALFNEAPDALVVVDEEGDISRANDRVEEMFGYEPAELEGETVETLVPEGARERHPEQRESYVEEMIKYENAPRPDVV